MATPLQLADRRRRAACASRSNSRLERLQGVDDVGAGAVAEIGLGGRQREVHARSVRKPGEGGGRCRGARDGVPRATAPRHRATQCR